MKNWLRVYAKTREASSLGFSFLRMGPDRRGTFFAFAVNSSFLDVAAGPHGAHSSGIPSGLLPRLMHDSEQYLLAMPAEDTPTLDNFVVGANGQAVMVLREVARGAGPKFVYLHGPKGAGLTHLLTALRPPSRFRVEPFDPAVKLYTVDDIDELDLGFSRQLRNLQNEVMRVPDARLVCAGRCPITRSPWGTTSRAACTRASRSASRRSTKRTAWPNSCGRPIRGVSPSPMK